MVVWPPLACTLAILLRLALTAAVGMSRRRLQQSSSAHDDEDGVAAAAAAAPPLLLPELLGRMLNDAAAAEDEGAFRLDDGSVWKPLRETDQVKAAGEHVGDLPDVKSELGAIEGAAAAIENELAHRQSALGGESPRVGAINEDVGHIPESVNPSKLRADAAQGTDASSNNEDLVRPLNPVASELRADSAQEIGDGSNYEELDRPDFSRSQEGLEEKTDEADAQRDSGLPANLANAAKKSEVDMLEPSQASESDSKSTQTVTAAADASAQTKAVEPESKPIAKERSVQTSRKASRDRHSQTATPVLMSMGTQTDIDAAPWYLFRTSVQKKRLAAAISVFFILLYFVLCYGVFAWAREFYEGEFLEEFEPFDFLKGLTPRARGQNAPV